MRGGLLWGTLTVIAVLAMAGCGAGSSTVTVTVTGAPSPTATVAPSPSISASPSAAGALTFHVELALGGADPVHGAFDQAAAAGGCGAPFHLAGDTGGHHVVITLLASGPNGGVNLSPGDLTVTVDADTWAYGSSANGPAGSSGSVSINNGTAALAFLNLQLQSDRAHTPQESGAVQWTCR